MPGPCVKCAHDHQTKFPGLSKTEANFEGSIPNLAVDPSWDLHVELHFAPAGTAVVNFPANVV